MVSARRSLVLFVIAAVLLLAFSPALGFQGSTAATPDPTGNIFNQVYDNVSPSVVAINVIANPTTSNFQGQSGPVMASGTGFVIDTNGHIVTNNHVVDGATRIEVDFLDGTLTLANVVGTDPDSDLAVLKVDVPQATLHPVTFGDSNKLEIGQTVLAIGGPFGQRWTLTSGIVSALDRTIQGLTNFSIGGVIQTDAPINPGNSGGPLLNLDGQVIGVDSQILSASGSNAGVGFAIPSDLVQKVSQALIKNGSVNYSYLGIAGGDVSLSLIQTLGIPNTTRGVVVSDVTPGGPADKAGLQAASNFTVVDGQQIPKSVDIITAINGTPLTGIADLISYLANNTAPGDSVKLSVLRNGTQTMDVTVQLTARPS